MKGPEKTKFGRIDKSMMEEFQRIAALRVANGLDKKYSPPTVMNKTLKHSLWPKIREDLKIARFLKDEKGQIQMFQLFTFMIVIFVAVVMFGGLIWISGQLNTVFHQIGLNNEGNAGHPGYANLTDAADRTFGQMNSGIQALRMVALCMIFAEICGVFIANALQRAHPAVFFVYILIIILAVIFAAPISNAYLTLMNSGIYDGNLQTFTGANWFLLNLPLVVGVVGVLGLVFLMVNLIRTGTEGTLS